MVDPYTYRDRLTKPKLLINGTNDRYWTLDALDFYWGGLKGPKYLVELPNAGHGLDQNRDWAINGLGAFFRHVVTGRPLPRLDWIFDADKDGEAALTIHAEPAPQLGPALDGPVGDLATSASRTGNRNRWRWEPRSWGGSGRPSTGEWPSSASWNTRPTVFPITWRPRSSSRGSRLTRKRNSRPLQREARLEDAGPEVPEAGPPAAPRPGRRRKPLTPGTSG